MKATSLSLAFTILQIVLLSPLILGAMAHASAKPPPPETSSSWETDGLEVTSTYFPLPDGQGWTNDVAVLPKPDRIFRYEPACVAADGDRMLLACTEAMPDCDAGEDGRAVVWEEASTLIDPPVWTRIGGFSCVYDENPIDVMDLIAGDIVSAFRNLDLDAGEVKGEPSPHTLRNAHTNLYSTAAARDANFELHGQQITVEARPVQYRWEYGDGSENEAFLTAGGPLPKGRWGEQTETSHQFPRTGDYEVRLSVTYRGTYRVNGGVDIAIPGDATFNATPLTISVWRSVVNNYADNCLENPKGAGC